MARHRNKTRLGWFALCSAGLISTSVGAAASPSPKVCDTRANDTVKKLDECISTQELRHYLETFQRIADQNPGADGHGNRNTGTAGYKASADYVAAQARRAGYTVTVQHYPWKNVAVTGTPVFVIPHGGYAFGQDWFAANHSGAGSVSAPIQPAASGCGADDWASFTPGNIALLARGSCTFDTAIANATRARAAAVILSNSDAARHDTGKSMRGDGGAFRARLDEPASIPVIGVASHAIGVDLAARYAAGAAPVARIEVKTREVSGVDYNVIADAPFGDPNHVVVVDAHLDAIYGAGILDNASGSATILEIARKLARTPTVNQLRYIWFGGEELGLLGSRYYTRHLRPQELRKIVFDNDVDVTATPNFAILIADPANAFDVKRFPPNVVPGSRIGNRIFASYFQSIGVKSLPAAFGNDGTDSNSFSLVGVPNTGILTQQDCCKNAKQVRFWGGFVGNYEGEVPGDNGGCVDRPHRWCDNLANTDGFVHWLVSKATAYTTFMLAENATLGSWGR